MTELRSVPPPEAPTPPGRIHGLAITGMAASALVGIASLFMFATVNWPGNIGRVILVIFFFSAVGFLASASAAVFSAARDTYVDREASN